MKECPKNLWLRLFYSRKLQDYADYGGNHAQNFEMPKLQLIKVSHFNPM